MKKTQEELKETINEEEIYGMYKKLQIDVDYSGELEEIVTDYHNMMRNIEYECYRTTAYISR